MDRGSSASSETIEEAQAVARRFIAQRYPGAMAALLAGSRARGEGGPRSDYDIFLLFDALPQGAWRERAFFEGRTFELFAHDRGTLSYFCRTVVGRSGVPSVPQMVVDGIALLGEGGTALAAARSLAARTLAAGPPPLDPPTRLSRVSAITELTEILADSPPGPARIVVGGALYPMLADFALRAAGAWGASMKRLPAAVAELDPALAGRFDAAFTALFRDGDPRPVLELADSILTRHGGRPRDGFRIASPPSWRD
ncbi:MAG TPA: nucleotidyltransferase domain-containing protein [Allosphingosinicella sp.]|jgi:hypothetical protein